MNILETLFTKIYKSIDLRWNKLINARTDNVPEDEKEMKPTEPNYDGELIINRDYVDSKTTYDTEKVKKYNNPFLQWWMKNISGKTYKELWDDLLFPRLAPKYVNPEFYDIRIEYSDIYKNGNKHVLFYGQTIKGRIYFKITESDRDSNLTASLRITYPNNVRPEIIYNSVTTSSDSYIDFEFLFIDGMTFNLEKVFLAADVKNDTYGDPSIPDDFKINYTLIKNVTDLLTNEICIYSPCYKLVTNYDADGNPESNGLTSDLYTDLTIKDNGFVVSDKINIRQKIEQELYLLLPVESIGENIETRNILDFEKSRYFFELYRGNMLIDKVEIPKTSLLRGAKTYKYRQIKYNDNSIITTRMIECIYHFGVYEEDMIGRIVIENKNNKDYMLNL